MFSIFHRKFYKLAADDKSPKDNTGLVYLSPIHLISSSIVTVQSFVIKYTDNNDSGFRGFEESSAGGEDARSAQYLGVSRQAPRSGREREQPCRTS